MRKVDVIFTSSRVAPQVEYIHPVPAVTNVWDRIFCTSDIENIIPIPDISLELIYKFSIFVGSYKSCPLEKERRQNYVRKENPLQNLLR